MTSINSSDKVPLTDIMFTSFWVGLIIGFVGWMFVLLSVYVRNGYELNRPKLAHELVHVLQIERSSLDQVITQHYSDIAESVYDKSPLEVEAFKANKQYSADW